MATAYMHVQNKEYEAARDQYLELIATGYSGEALYYNLGICYFELEDYPRAILHFEKTLKLDPGDANARHNLQLANQRVGQTFIPIRDFFLKRWWRAVYQWVSPAGWGWISVLLGLLLSVSFYFYLFPLERIGWKTGKRVFYPVLVLLLVALAAGSSRLSEIRDSRLAITLSPTGMFEGPDERSTELYTLPAGTKVRLLDRIGQWQKVELINKEQGWVEEDPDRLAGI